MWITRACGTGAFACVREPISALYRLRFEILQAGEHIPAVVIIGGGAVVTAGVAMVLGPDRRRLHGSLDIRAGWESM
jgi:hypothetical protein